MNANWPNVPLAELLTERNEEPSPEVLANGGIRMVAKIGFNDGRIYFRSPDQSKTRTKMILARPGDLVISGINADQGAVAIYDPNEAAPVAATIHYAAYVVNTARTCPQFLWLLLRSQVFRSILNHSVPEGIKTELKAKRLLPLRVPVPPLAEQQRLVSRIGGLLDSLREAMRLHEEASGELSGVVVRQAQRAIMQETAEYCTLQDVLLDRPRNGWSPPASTYGDAGVPVLTLAAVTGYRYNATKFKLTTVPTQEQAHYWLRPGELLITRSNTPELVGHAAIYDGNPPRCICPDLVMKMCVDRSRADTRFVHYWLQTEMVRNHIKARARGTSRSMKKIGQHHVQTIPVPRLPLEEQRAIVTMLDELDTRSSEAKKEQAEIAEELAALGPALTAKALRGEL